MSDPLLWRVLVCGGRDLVVAFPGGSGTSDMIKKAEKVGVDVLRG